VEIHKQTVAVYGNVMNRQNMTKWCREFSEGRTDVHDKQRSGKPSLISDDLLQAANFYDSGIQKLVPGLNKCLDNAGIFTFRTRLIFIHRLTEWHLIGLTRKKYTHELQLHRSCAGHPPSLQTHANRLSTLQMRTCL
jgi:hypothetical protein